MNIKETVYQLIHQQFGEELSFTDETLLKEELGIDSYKAINFLYELQNAGIALKSYNVDTIKTVGDLIKALKYE